MQGEARRDRGSSRVALVTSLLSEQLTDIRSARVLDCGGGSGAYAVPLAIAGADVTVVDISADALATLRRRADEAGVAERVHSVAADLEAPSDLGGLVGERGFDAVLAHGILDSGGVSSVTDTFTAMSAAVRAGGVLSVVVANPIAGVVARALAGEPVAALAELRRIDAAAGAAADWAASTASPNVSDHAGDHQTPPARATPEAVVALGEAAGLTVLARHGIGVFSDLVPGSAGETAGGREAVSMLDAHAASRSPFAELAGRIHIVFGRPAS